MKTTFDRCVTVTSHKGRMEIQCKLGLWSVCGTADNWFKLQQEAMHYWIQYFDDGEYTRLLTEPAK